MQVASHAEHNLTVWVAMTRSGHTSVCRRN